MDIKNWMIVTLALTLVIFLGVLESGVLNEKKISNSNSARQVRGVIHATVKLSKDGNYYPETVTIKAGEAVKWVNSSESLMWPASNPHPSHTGLSGFDPKKILHPGESWQFTFTRPGTFGYHDHLQPARRGKVIVEE